MYVKMLTSGSVLFVIWMFLCSRSDNVKAGDQYTAVYIIRGLSLGRTDIVATAVQHGKKNFVKSDAREIQVCTDIIRPHGLHTVQRCGVLLRMSPVVRCVCVCLSVCVFGTQVSCVKMAEPVKMPFGVRLLCPRNCFRWVSNLPIRMGTFELTPK